MVFDHELFRKYKVRILFQGLEGIGGAETGGVQAGADFKFLLLGEEVAGCHRLFERGVDIGHVLEGHDTLAHIPGTHLFLKIDGHLERHQGTLPVVPVHLLAALLVQLLENRNHEPAGLFLHLEVLGQVQDFLDFGGVHGALGEGDIPDDVMPALAVPFHMVGVKGFNLGLYYTPEHHNQDHEHTEGSDYSTNPYHRREFHHPVVQDKDIILPITESTQGVVFHAVSLKINHAQVVYHQQDR